MNPEASALIAEIEAKNQIRKERLATAQILADRLALDGWKVLQVSSSVNSFGASAYVYVIKEGWSEGDAIKFRVSDHGCGDTRILNEVHIMEEMMEQQVSELGAKYFPELYEVNEVEDGYITHERQSMDLVEAGEEIVSVRITKKTNREIPTIRRVKYKTVITRK